MGNMFLFKPTTVHTLWPCYMICHCEVFQHDSVMSVLLLYLALDLLILQSTLVWLLKCGCFSYLKVNWFRCWIKDQTRLGGDLFTKDVMAVGMKIYECFVSNIRLKTPDYTHFVSIWGVCWVCMIQMRHYCLKMFQIPYHHNCKTFFNK